MPVDLLGSPYELAQDVRHTATPQKLSDYRSTKRGNKIARACQPLITSDDKNVPENEGFSSTDRTFVKTFHAPPVITLHQQLPNHQINNNTLPQHHQYAQRDLVLHPINFNAKFDRGFLSPQGVFSVRDFKKTSNFHLRDNRGSFPLDDGDKDQKGLSIEHVESSFFDIQEDCSTPFGVDSKSTVGEAGDLVLWGNAVFCSEAWALTSCDTSWSSLRSGRKVHERRFSIEEGSNQNIKRRFSDASLRNSHEVEQRRLSTGQDSSQFAKGSLSDATLDHSDDDRRFLLKVQNTTASSTTLLAAYKPHRYSVATSPSAVADTCSNCPPTDFSPESLIEHHNHGNRQSSVGSTLCAQQSVVENLQYQQLCEGFVHNLLLEKPKESVALDASPFSPLIYLSAKEAEIVEDVKNEEKDILAELELEIEKDLEREIKTKIFLLHRRLDQLHSLQTRRYTKDHQSVELVTSSMEAAEEPERYNNVTSVVEISKTDAVSPRPKLGVKAIERKPSENHWRRPPTPEQCKGRTQAGKEYMFSRHHSAKKILPVIAESDTNVHFSYDRSPVISWKKLVSVSSDAMTEYKRTTTAEQQEPTSDKLSHTASLSKSYKAKVRNESIAMKRPQSFTSIAATCNSSKKACNKACRGGSSPQISRSQRHPAPQLPSQKLPVVRDLFQEECGSLSARVTHSSNVSKALLYVTPSRERLKDVKVESNCTARRPGYSKPTTTFSQKVKEGGKASITYERDPGKKTTSKGSKLNASPKEAELTASSKAKEGSHTTTTFSYSKTSPYCNHLSRTQPTGIAGRPSITSFSNSKISPYKYLGRKRTTGIVGRAPAERKGKPGLPFIC